MAKIVATADNHTDATSVGGWDRDAGMHSNWVEANRQVRRSVQVANEQQADLLVIPGDLFNTGHPKPEVVAMFDDAMRELETAKVIILDGNHDQQGILAQHRTPASAFYRNREWCYATVSEPTVIEYNGLYLALLPWLRVAGSSQLPAANDNLKETIERLFDDIKDGPSLLFGHIVLDECSFDSGRRSSELMMTTTAIEASVPTEVLDAGPTFLNRLGHIHKRQDLSQKTGYVGSPYKISFGEVNDDKGCDLITVDDNGATLDFVKFDVRELYKIDMTSSEGAPMLEVIEDKVNPGDIIRFILPEGEAFPRIDILSDSIRNKGCEVQVHRRYITRKKTLSTGPTGLATDMNPIDAVKAYMTKEQVEVEDRHRLIDVYKELAHHE